MESRKLRSLMETLSVLLFYAKGLNWNAEAMLIQRDRYNILLSKLDALKALYTDKEKFLALSSPEQSALFQNAQQYNDTIIQVDRELNYLDASRHSIPVSQMIHYLEEALYLTKHLNDYVIENDGEIAFADLKHFKEEHFKNAPYNGQVNTLQMELEYILVVNLSTTCDNYGIFSRLGIANQYAKEELARILKEKPEPAKEIKMPTEIVPEVSEQPTEEDLAKAEANSEVVEPTEQGASFDEDIPAPTIEDEPKTENSHE